jgi:hypothetical protein
MREPIVTIGKKSEPDKLLSMVGISVVIISRGREYRDAYVTACIDPGRKALIVPIIHPPAVISNLYAWDKMPRKEQAQTEYGHNDE